MLCVIVEPTIKNEYKYTKEYFFISCCKNKRISYTTASSLSEAADIIGRRGGSVLLYAASEKWAINMIRQNSSLGLNLIIAEAFRLQSGSKFSSVCTDVATQISEVCNYLNLCGVKSTAFFGARSVISWQVAADEAISYYIPTAKYTQYFRADESLSKAYRSFLRNGTNLESVICPNDLIAIYLISRLKKDNPELLKKLFVISLESSALSKCFSESITSFCGANQLIAQKTVELCRRTSRDKSAGMHISCFPEFKIGNSTHMKNPTRFNQPEFLDLSRLRYLSTDNMSYYYNVDDEYNDLLRLEYLIQTASDYDLAILSAITRLNNYAEISSYMNVSIDSVKYYTSKLYRRAGFESRKKLKAVLMEYFSPLK